MTPAEFRNCLELRAMSRARHPASLRSCRPGDRVCRCIRAIAWPRTLLWTRARPALRNFSMKPITLAAVLFLLPLCDAALAQPCFTPQACRQLREQAEAQQAAIAAQQQAARDARVQPVPRPSDSTVNLLSHGGTFHVQAVLNGTTSVLFMLDSGATDVIIPRRI